MKVAGETWRRSRRSSPAAGSYIQPWWGEGGGCYRYLFIFHNLCRNGILSFPEPGTTNYGLHFLLPLLEAMQGLKILEFQLAPWADNIQILPAWSTSPLVQVFKLINNSWTKNGSYSVAWWALLPVWLASNLLSFDQFHLPFPESVFSIHGTGLCVIQWYNYSKFVFLQWNW